MKHSILLLMILAGITSADVQYFDFGNMQAADAISITTQNASGQLTAMSGNYSFSANQEITLSQTLSNKNGWCDPFSGTLPSNFSDANYADALTTQSHQGSSGILTLTFTDLETGIYSLDVFGGIVGKDHLSQMTITILSANNTVVWTNVKGTDLNGAWSTEGCSTSGTSATITGIDYANRDHDQDPTTQSDYPTITKGYMATADNIEISDGTLTLKVEGIGGNNSWSRTALNGVSLRMVPEPTTATLSLLALAGLAMRRRRR